MKKIVILMLCLCFICLSGCSMDVNEIALENKYDVDSVSDYKISVASGLGLKLLSYVENGVDKNVYLLAYLNDDNIEINSENTYIKSLVTGQTYISMTSTIIDIDRSLNISVLRDLIMKLNNKLNENNAEIYVEHINEGDNKFYIISKNDTYVFIDYLTTLPNVTNKVIYYRIILEDISLLNKELTQDEIENLPNFLPELLDVLDIDEVFELPK